jgi:D-methionine transport system substrate-binding protein
MRWIIARKKITMKKILTSLLLLVLVFSLLGCAPSTTDDKTIRVGASPTPHAQILNVIKDDLAALGYTLEIVEFTDYVLPNTALDAGDLDANYFQHRPYLNKFNAEKGTKLSFVLAIHFEPLGLYPGKESSLDGITKGGASVAIPNDPTNEARALRLLADLGYITIAAGKEELATPLDIVNNPYNISFVEVESALLTTLLQDVDFAIINGNYALSANIASTVLTTESKESLSAQTFANGLVVKEGKENDPKTLALIQVLNSAKVKQFIVDSYTPTVLSVLD